MQTETETETANSVAEGGAPRDHPGYVLVVDDEEPNRMLLQDLLEAHGYECGQAADGAQALHQVAARPPDVVLLDVMMPAMDGFEVCRRLKGDPHTAPIPILMVTALSEHTERLMGIQAGADDFLSKPVDLQELLLRVRNATRAKGLFNQLQRERETSERLLLNILPEPIARRMKNGEVTIADYHHEVSLLLADLAGFTAMASHIGADQVVFLLNEIFSDFDRLVEARGLEKIKTAGDAYLVAGGLLVPRPDHARAIAALALDMQAAISGFNAQYNSDLRLRAAISTGSLVSGVIGQSKFAFDLWGEAVNRVCQVKSWAPPGTILVDEAAYEHLNGAYRFADPRAKELPSGGSLKVRQISASSSWR